MKKITCITPTLWMAPEFIHTCDILNSVKHIAEVIIIDNNSKKRLIDFNKYGTPVNTVTEINGRSIETTTYGKFIVLDPKENLYVSEPWNIGASLATSPVLCLLNDDTIPDPRTFTFISEKINKDIGIVGLDAASFGYIGFRPAFQPINTRTYGFGCCMFILKNKYVPIPSTIKVFFNDDFLLHKVKGPKVLLTGVAVRGRVSATIDDAYIQVITEDIKRMDQIAFKELVC